MTPTEQLKSILTEQDVSEDGDAYKVELKQGLTVQQIDDLAKGPPTGLCPDLTSISVGKRNIN